jgi:tetratricopeptide (TPR) repeat protein
MNPTIELSKVPVNNLVRAGYLGLLASIFLHVAFPAKACLWDTDTLAAEQARFPEIAELITGMFPRHSKEFYAWRLLHSENLIAQGKGGAIAFDDLAVAQHKLGDHRAAIETMQLKEKRFPGLYETRSNLGTFYIYTDELDAAAKWIREALAVNPDAHFGREKYQLCIVEWLQERKNAPADLSKGIERSSFASGVPHGFAAFTARRAADQAGKSDYDLQLTRQEQSSALRGLLGMMWFADFDNPLLLEALGDVLIAGDMNTNASQLAALAYLHASRRAANIEEKKRLHGLFQASLLLIPDVKVENYEKKLDSGLAKGTASFEVIRQEELKWIKAGMDAGFEFQKKYLKP